MEVARRLGNGFPDVRQRREVDTRLDFTFVSYSRDHLAVADISFIEGDTGWYRGTMTSIEIVENNHLFTTFQQQFCCDTSNVSRATSN